MVLHRVELRPESFGGAGRAAQRRRRNLGVRLDAPTPALFLRRRLHTKGQFQCNGQFRNSVILISDLCSSEFSSRQFLSLTNPKVDPKQLTPQAYRHVRNIKEEKVTKNMSCSAKLRRMRTWFSSARFFARPRPRPLPTGLLSASLSTDSPPCNKVTSSKFSFFFWGGGGGG